MSPKWQLVTRCPNGKNHLKDLLKIQISGHIARKLDLVKTEVWWRLELSVFLCMWSWEFWHAANFGNHRLVYQPLGSEVEVREEERILVGRCPLTMVSISLFLLPLNYHLQKQLCPHQFVVQASTPPSGTTSGATVHTVFDVDGILETNTSEALQVLSLWGSHDRVTNHGQWFPVWWSWWPCELSR